MSWGAYLTNLKGSGNLANAAIIGYPDCAVWATDGLQFLPGELESIARGFGENSPLRTTGVKINGVKYIFLQAQDDQIQGKKGQTGITIGKANKCMIIGVYNENHQPGNARTTVANMVDYLKNQNY